MININHPKYISPIVQYWYQWVTEKRSRWKKINIPKPLMLAVLPNPNSLITNSTDIIGQDGSLHNKGTKKQNKWLASLKEYKDNLDIFHQKSNRLNTIPLEPRT